VCLGSDGRSGCGEKPASAPASGECGAGAAMPVKVKVVESKPIAEKKEYLGAANVAASAADFNPQARDTSRDIC